MNVSFSLFWNRGNELIVVQMGFYYCPLCTSARKNIEEYDMGNTQHQEEGWSRSATTAMFPRANFSESKAIEESCLSLCVLYKHITVCTPQTNPLYGLRGREGGILQNETQKGNALEPYLRPSSQQQKIAFPLPPSFQSCKYSDHFGIPPKCECKARNSCAAHATLLHQRFGVGCNHSMLPWKRWLRL